MAKLLRLIMKESASHISKEMKVVYDACKEAYKNGELNEDLLKHIYEDLDNMGIDYNKEEVDKYFYELLNKRDFDVEESVVTRVAAEETLDEDSYITINDGQKADPDYIIQDVTELKDLDDGDVEAPSIEGLLSLVNESLSNKYGDTWGYMKSKSISMKENLQYAIIDIVTPSILKEAENNKIKDRAVSKTVILENVPNSKSLVNLKINTLAGTTRFSQKTKEPAKVLTRWLESEYLYDEMVKDFQAKIEARQAELKDTIETFLKQHPELKLRVETIKAQEKLLKDAGALEDNQAELSQLAYNIAAEFPANTNVKGNKDNEYTQEFDTIDEIVKILFGESYVREASKEEKDLEKKNKAVKDALKENQVTTSEKNEKADSLIKSYFNHKMDLETLHNKLEKVFGNKKDAFEYFRKNENRVKSLKEGYESFKIGDIEGTFNPDSGEAMYSIPSKNVKDKKINLSKIPSVDTPYDTDTIIKDYIEKNYGVINSEETAEKPTEQPVEEPSTIDIDEPEITDGSEELNEEVQSETGTASFYKIRQREPINIEQVIEKSSQGANTQESEYIVVKEISLSEEEMNSLTSDLSKPQSFLQNVEAIDRKNYAFNVVKVTSNNSSYTLLIDPVGYSYPRYISIINN